MRWPVLCFALLAFLSGGRAHAAACDDLPKAEDFWRFGATSAVTADFGTHTMTPFGRAHELILGRSDADDFIYSVFARERGDPNATVIRADVIQVVRDPDANLTHIRFRMHKPEGAAWHRTSGGYSFIVTACPRGAPAQVADASDEGFVAAAALTPVYFATGEHTFSTGLNGGFWVGLAALACAVVLWAWYRYCLQQTEDPGKAFRMMLAGKNYRLSLSKLQLMVFSIAVLLVVAYVYGRTQNLSDLSSDVLLLLGISAGSAATAAVADNLKSRLSWDNWIWLRDKGVIPTPKTADMGWFELVSSHGEFDPARFQALVFTLVVAPAFLLMSIYNLADADIPQGILAVLGLSQATYIVGKIVAPPTIGDFDKQLTEYRRKEAAGELISPEETKALQSGFEAALEHPWNPQPAAAKPADGVPVPG